MQTGIVKEAFREAATGQVADKPQAPPMPETLEDTGLKRAYISDLLLKTLYTYGAQSGDLLSQRILLPYTLLDDVMMELQQRRMSEVRGTRPQVLRLRSYVRGPNPGA